VCSLPSGAVGLAGLTSPSRCRYIYPNADLARVEANLASVVGFFVVEKTISKYVFASPTISKYVGPSGLLSNVELAEWWTDAQRKLIASLDSLEFASSKERTRVKAAVERFTRCLRSYDIDPRKLEEWV